MYAYPQQIANARRLCLLLEVCLNPQLHGAYRKGGPPRGPCPGPGPSHMSAGSILPGSKVKS